MAKEHSNPITGGGENPFDGAEMIHAYPRAQAIEDGVLVDVPPTAAEPGFHYPVALTRAVWEDCVAWDEEGSKRQTPQDEAGWLWDVLVMARCGIHALREGGVMRFNLYRVPRGGRVRSPRLVLLKLVCGPGDEGEPVLTIVVGHVHPVSERVLDGDEIALGVIAQGHGVAQRIGHRSELVEDGLVAVIPGHGFGVPWSRGHSGAEGYPLDPTSKPSPVTIPSSAN